MPPKKQQVVAQQQQQQSLVIVLKDRVKIVKLCTIIKMVKEFSDYMGLIIKQDKIQIQVMDSSKVCTCECKLGFEWFDNVDQLRQYGTTTDTPFVFSTKMFYSIISTMNDNQILHMEFDKMEDNFKLHVLYEVPTKDNVNRYFTLPLIGQEQELLNIGAMDYNVEFTMNAETIYEIFKQMMLFSTGVAIECDEDSMKISSNNDGLDGSMKVEIATDDMEEFAIDEGFNLNIEFSLTHIMKYGLAKNLVPNIMFYMSENAPMKIKYDLEPNVTTVEFYICPKIMDE